MGGQTRSDIGRGGGRISTQAIIKAVRKPVPKQTTLFADPQLPLKDVVQFYQHDIDWTNRLILGSNSHFEKLSGRPRKANTFI